jgi:uncharacterized membrane protein
MVKKEHLKDKGKFIAIILTGLLIALVLNYLIEEIPGGNEPLSVEQNHTLSFINGIIFIPIGILILFLTKKAPTDRLKQRKMLEEKYGKNSAMVKWTLAFDNFELGSNPKKTGIIFGILLIVIGILFLIFSFI